MGQTDKGLLYHLGSALGARDSHNCVSWLSTHLLCFPAHEAYRKELRTQNRKRLENKLGKKQGKEHEKQLLYDPSSTLSLMHKWGPSIRNILCSMEYDTNEEDDPIEVEALSTAISICKSSNMFNVSAGVCMPQSEGSSILFLRRTPGGSVKLNRGKTFIPTSHLLAIFEEQRQKMSNKESLEYLALYCYHGQQTGC